MNAFDALQNAYDICFLVSDHCGNVIASGEPTQSDVDNKEKADAFIRWYNSRRRRSKGDWTEKLQKSMDKLLGEIESI